MGRKKSHRYLLGRTVSDAITHTEHAKTLRNASGPADLSREDIVDSIVVCPVMGFCSGSTKANRALALRFRKPAGWV